MTTPNRPPSCDRLNPELKECPFCGSEDVELRDGYDLDQINHYVRCNECEADGPWHDDTDANKWNSMIRRSDVMELLNKLEFLMLASDWNRQDEFEDLKRCGDKLRQEIGE